MKADDFKKLAVVSIDSGAKLGYVDDLLFDTGQLVVSAFRIKAEGQEMVLPLSEIRSIGKDAITVPNDSVMRTTSAVSELAALPGIEQLMKLKVVDEHGNFVGQVKEIDVDAKDGKITEVSTHEGGVLGIGGKTTTIVAAAIRSIGDEVMIVTMPAKGGPEKK
jgi:sporulation protein YlmC with PRC-barrel domain